MNVVGKVGSLISQGVYSVATPFHPFGGAVDVIVVRQQDGSFRSTPWYVRFGKFQGVLKGAEKVVHITVNGVEADFHMCLDNSGEAYFIREFDDVGQGFETNGGLKESDREVIQDDVNKHIAEFCRLEHCVSDSRVAQLRDEFDSIHPKRLERAESDTRFYEFQDEPFSLEDSVNLSEFGSGQYEGLDGERFGEEHGLDSEVVLVSVDGHVLTAPVSESEHTAPVSESEQSAENVQLSTHQFRLGPGEGPEYREDNAEFSSGENVRAANYISKLSSAADKDSSCDVCNVNVDSNALRHHLGVCQEGGEHACQIEEAENVSNHEGEFNMQSDVEDASVNNKKGDAFKSCLELSELGRHGEIIDSEQIDSPLKASILQDKPSCSPLDIDETEDGAVGDSRNKDVFSSSCSPNSSNNNGSPDLPVEVETVEKKVFDSNYLGSNHNSVSVGNDPLGKDEQFGTSVATEGIKSSSQSYAPEAGNKSSKSKSGETEATSGKEIDSRANPGFDISLCGNELSAGMGLDAAAVAFEAHRLSEEEYRKNAMSAFGLELAVEPQDAVPVEQDETSNPKDDASIVTCTTSGRRWQLWPIPFGRGKTLERSDSNSSSEEVFVDTESDLQNSQADSMPASGRRIESPSKQFIRTNIPTNEQIASLNLKDGQNMITFSFSTRVLGTQQVDAHLYLWKWNAKIVISDVDGTITKSDVLGQFMPLVGRDWTQSGVAKLFSAIKENGYQLLFLSARAIVQAYLTRNFLLNLKQDGKALPNGPVVISPDGLFPSLYREVIRRAPHEFKIACLEDIKKLFPSDYNPFYAGFGNRDTDELSYRKIGIPKGKIFIINPKGEVAISHRIDVRSYTSLHTLVNGMFPPTSLVEQEDFNSWNFWKVPLPDIE